MVDAGMEVIQTELLRASLQYEYTVPGSVRPWKSGNKDGMENSECSATTRAGSLPVPRTAATDCGHGASARHPALRVSTQHSALSDAACVELCSDISGFEPWIPRSPPYKHPPTSLPSTVPGRVLWITSEQATQPFK